MVNVTSEVVNLLKKNYRQVVRITVTRGNDSFIIDESKVLQGGLTIDRYSMSGTTLEIGSAIAAELSVRIKNDDGEYNSTFFEGSELYVELGIKKWDAGRWENAQVHYIPCGKYVIDTPPRSKSTIVISALDYMTKFDKAADMTSWTFPMTVKSLITTVCTACGVTVDTDLDTLMHHDYVISNKPTTENLTYRMLIQWCAFITGTNAYFGGDGKLIFKWYGYPVPANTDATTITASDRYYSDLYENDIIITGLKYIDSNSDTHFKGSNDYVLTYSGCDIIQSNADTVITDIYNAIKDFSFRPYEATVKPAPYFYPMDMISFVDKAGTEHDGIINHVTFTMNASTSISGITETAKVNSYEKPEMTLQEKIANSSIHGLYKTTEVLPDQSEINYIHDKPVLSDSQLVIKITAEGVSISNDGGSTWDYSFNFVTGAAIIRTIETDNAWITDLFAQNITATGTISGATLTGSSVTTQPVQGRYLRLSGDSLWAGLKDTDNYVTVWSFGVEIQFEDNIESPFTMHNTSLPGLAVLTTTLSKDSNSQDFAYPEDENTYSEFRIPRSTAGSITISPSDFNTVINVPFYEDIDYDLMNDGIEYDGYAIGNNGNDTTSFPQTTGNTYQTTVFFSAKPNTTYTVRGLGGLMKKVVVSSYDHTYTQAELNTYTVNNQLSGDLIHYGLFEGSASFTTGDDTEMISVSWYSSTGSGGSLSGIELYEVKPKFFPISSKPIIQIDHVYGVSGEAIFDGDVEITSVNGSGFNIKVNRKENVVAEGVLSRDNAVRYDNEPITIYWTASY